MATGSDASALRAVRTRVQANSYPPFGTVKCTGSALFRSQAARDLACLFDLDRTVVSWRCLPASLSLDDTFHLPDFLVVDKQGNSSLVDAFDNVTELPTDMLEGEAARNGLIYRQVAKSDVYEGVRLRNAKDLLRYARVRPALSDRVKLLSAISEEGRITLAECWRVLPGRDAVAIAAALVLQSFIDIDWEVEPIGPDTVVRRIGS